MDDVTIKQDAGGFYGERVSQQRLDGLVGSRLCHDLISPLGAIGNGLELLQISGDFPAIHKSPELQLIAESVEAARCRINWFRVAFGHYGLDQRISGAALAELLASADRSGRIRIHFDAEGDLARSEARMILLSMMCLESAMPWGGRVLICRGETGWRLVAEAERTKIDPGLWNWLDHRNSQNLPSPNPAEVHFALLAQCARDLSRELSWELDEKGGAISF